VARIHLLSTVFYLDFDFPYQVITHTVGLLWRVGARRDHLVSNQLPQLRAEVIVDQADPRSIETCTTKTCTCKKPALNASNFDV